MRSGRGATRSKSRRGGPSRTTPWLLAAVALSVVPFGAVDVGFGHVSTLAIAAVFVAAVMSAIGRPADFATAWITVATGLALCAYVLWQTSPGASPAIADGAWADVPGASPRVSVDPEAGWRGLGLLLSPLLVFAAAVLVARRDQDGIRLLNGLAGLGAACALYGLLQFHFMPDWLLWAPKTAYTESLTAVFVNRNTAATFLGCTALVIAGLLIRAGGEIPRGTFLANLTGRSGRFSPLRPRIQALAVGLVAVLAALFQTQSRAGLAATAVGFVVLVALAALAGRPEIPRDRRDAAPDLAEPLFYRARRWIALAAGLGAVATVVLVFGDRALGRAAVLGLDDGRFCVYRGVLDAIADRPLWGSGFGTFEAFFPAYRDPTCGLWGLWARAHNTYLEGYLGLGLPFVVATLIAYGILLMRLGQGLRHRRRLRWAPIIGLSVLTLVSLHSLIDFPLQIRGMAVYAAAVLGACTGLCLRWERYGGTDLAEERAFRRSSLRLASTALAVVGTLVAVGLSSYAVSGLWLEARVAAITTARDRLSAAPKLSMSDLDLAADRAAGLLASSCHPGLRRAALDLQILRLSRTETVAPEPVWLGYLSQAIPVAEKVLSCSPVDGVTWAQVALLRRAQGATPASIASALEASARYAPAELPALKLRLAAIAADAERVRADQWTIALGDFNTVAHFLWPEEAAAILVTYYDKAPDVLIEALRPLSAQRRRDFERVGLDLERLAGSAAMQNQLTSPSASGNLEVLSRTLTGSRTDH